MKPYKVLSEYLNLNDLEARLYVAATKARDFSISDLSKASDISRTSVYLPLQKLIAKGLITKSKIGQRLKYNAVDPKILSSLFERNKSDLDRLVYDLGKSYLSSQSNISVEFFSGTTGVSSALEIFLDNTKTKLWKTFETNSGSPIPNSYHFEDYIRRRVEKGIFARSIISIGTMTPWLKERLSKTKEEMHEEILISEKIFPMPAIIGITKGMTVFIGISDFPYAVLIKSAEISGTLSTIHDLVWSKFAKE